MVYLFIVILVVTLAALILRLTLNRVKTNSEETSGSDVLLFFLIVVSVQIVIDLAFEIYELPSYIEAAQPFGLVYGPVFYYSLEKYFKNPRSFKSFVLHLIPFFIGLIGYIIFILSSEIRAHYSEPYYKVLYFFIGTSLIGYPLASLISNRHQRESPLTVIRFKSFGIVALVILGLLMSIFAFSPILVRLELDNEFPRFVIYTLILAQMLGILLQLIRFTVNRFKVDQEQCLDNDSKVEETPLSYQKSLIPESKLDLLEIEVRRIMDEDRVFKDVDLTLESLARQLGISKHNLTQLLNVRLEKNFSYFVNEYRISYACELLIQNSNDLKIEDLAFTCGFKSKVSFYRNFKKITGVTPSEYRENP